MNSKTDATVGPILFPFTGASVGGSHISTFHLARSLMRDHGIPCVVMAAADSAVARQASEMGLPITGTGDPPAKSSRPWRDLVKLPQRMRVLRVYGSRAVVHCSDLWALQSWGLAGRMLGLPIVYHHRKILAMSWFDKARIQMAHTVISISEPCRQNLGFLADYKVHSLLNPFPPPMLEHPTGWRAEFKARWQEKRSPILVGFVGQFQRRKRPDFFLEVCRFIADREPDARFLMFGRERDFRDQDLEDHAWKLGLADKVVLAGFRVPPEMNLATLDILLAPALAEPFGRTLVEALLLGVPFVATDDAGHREIAARWGGGCLVRSDATPEQFADATLKILAAPGEIVLPAQTRLQIAKELAPRSHAAKVLEIYQQIYMVKQ